MGSVRGASAGGAMGAGGVFGRARLGGAGFPVDARGDFEAVDVAVAFAGARFWAGFALADFAPADFAPADFARAFAAVPVADFEDLVDAAAPRARPFDEAAPFRPFVATPSAAGTDPSPAAGATGSSAARVTGAAGRRDRVVATGGGYPSIRSGRHRRASRTGRADAVARAPLSNDPYRSVASAGRYGAGAPGSGARERGASGAAAMRTRS